MLDKSVTELNAKTSRILLVDDEPDIVTVLKQGLKLKGFEVDGFTDPQKALAQFRPGYYDFMVSDIRMPAVDGFQLCRKIQEKDQNVKIFLLSAFDAYEKEAEAMSPTLRSTFIKKPIRYDELAARLMQK